MHNQRVLLERELTDNIIGAAVEVHRALGPGLLERLYRDALACELTLRRVPFAVEVGIPVTYRGHRLGAPLRIDLLVDDRVIIEVKSVKEVLDVHRAQLMTYLKLRSGGIGLLLNFNVIKMTDGITRRVV